MLSDKSPDERGATSAALINERYELAEKVGEGNFFTVYRGRDTVTGRTVAIKIVNAEYAADREFIDRLRTEVLAAAQLNHPHIISVLDAWNQDGRVAIATEFVRGINLKERIRRVAPFPLAVAVDIAAAVAEALEYAGSQGFAHGDLRPENILVSPEGQVKLADFGIGAAVCASSRLQMSALLHSAHYLPPEVAQGKLPSPPSDVYSLGAILFEMLAGQPPFQADTPFAIAVKHLHEAPPLLRRLNPGVPKAVEGIALKCLQKDPAARYPSPAALLNDLRRVREALRYGKPLTWSPAPEEGAPPLGRGAGSPSRAGAPTAGSAAATNVPRAAAEAARPGPTPTPAAVSPEPRSTAALSRSAAEPVPGEPSLRLLLLLPLMALFLAGAVFALMVLGTRAPKDTVVPNVRGMTQDEAQRALLERGLKLRVVRERYDDKIPAGTVLFSDPPADSQAKQEKTVEVWLSRGPEPATVPGLVDSDEKDARFRIREARLTVGPVQQQYDETVPKGTVISQDPAAGTQVARRAAVSLVVSKGPEPLPPPEPETPPETAAPPPDTSTPPGAATDGTATGDTSSAGASGTLTEPGSSGTPAGTGTDSPGVVTDNNREFSIKTKLEGQKGWSRLRIMVTDQRGRRQVVNQPYARGQTVTHTIKAVGPPGGVRIEVWENRKLVKDMRY